MKEQSTETILALIQKDISNIKTDIEDIKEHLENDYLTKVEFYSKFNPIEKIVTSLVALVLVGFVGAIIRMVIIK